MNYFLDITLKWWRMERKKINFFFKFYLHFDSVSSSFHKSRDKIERINTNIIRSTHNNVDNDFLIGFICCYYTARNQFACFALIWTLNISIILIDTKGYHSAKKSNKYLSVVIILFSFNFSSLLWSSSKWMFLEYDWDEEVDFNRFKLCFNW